MTLDEMTKILQVPVSKPQSDGATEDATDTEHIQRAMKPSLAAADPLSQEKAASPVADLAEPTEELPNPLSKEPSPAPSTASTVVSPATTNTQSQTGEKEIVLSPGTEVEEKMIVIIGGEAQGAEHGGDAIIQKD